jgi:hypothetical protein
MQPRSRKMPSELTETVRTRGLRSLLDFPQPCHHRPLVIPTSISLVPNISRRHEIWWIAVYEFPHASLNLDTHSTSSADYFQPFKSFTHPTTSEGNQNELWKSGLAGWGTELGSMANLESQILAIEFASNG